MSYRDLFVEMYQDDTVEYLEFDDANFGAGEPLGYKMQVMITKEGVRVLTSCVDEDTGEINWVPDPDTYRSLDEAASVIISRYLQHYKTSPDAITEEMGLTTMQEWMHEFSGKPVVVE